MAADKSKLVFNPLTGSFDVTQDVSGLAELSDLADYVPLTEKGAANGVATLNGSGLIPNSQMPPISITDTFVVASEAAMLALTTAETGDVAVRTDLSKSFILKGTTYSVLADWQELLTPTDAVLSVNGETGIVSLDSDDVPEGSTNLYYTTARAAAKANVALDNLASTAVNTDITPATNNTVSLGTNSLKYTQVNALSGLFTNIKNAASSIVMDLGAQALTDAGALIAIWSANGFSLRPNKQLTFKSPDNVTNLNLQGPVNGTANTTYTLPGDGTTGQVLQTDGTGTLSWVAQTAVGANTTLSNLGTTSVNADLLPSANNTRNLGSSVLTWADSFLNKISSSSGAQIDVANRALQFNGSTVASWFNNGLQFVTSKLLRFTTDDGLSTIGIKPPASAASLDYTIPSAAPTANGQVLSSDTSGILSWTGLPSSNSVNLIQNGNADNATASIFVPYDDGQVAYPIDGTGGSPVVTTSISSASPLSGTKSYILSKPFVTTVGQGWAIDNIPLDLAYRAKSLKVSFDYLISAGIFTAGNNGASPSNGSVICTFYDITNSKIVEPSNIKLFSNSSTITDKYEATVQFDSNCTAVRFIMHVATGVAQNFDIKVDNISLSPQTYVYGTPITDWQSYTPTFVGLGTVSNIFMQSRRVGDTLEVKGYFQCGTNNASIASMTLGYRGNANVAIDNTKIGNVVVVGHGASQSTASTVYFGYVTVLTPASGGSTVNFGVQTSITVATTAQTGAGAFSNNVYVNVNFAVPILGWSSSVQVSDGYDGRVVSFLGSGTGSTQSLTANVTNISFTSVADKTNSWTGSTYVVPSAGDYNISAFVYSAATSLSVMPYINGVSLSRWLLYSPAGFGGSGKVLLPNLKAGDVLSLRSNISATIAADVSQNISIEKLPGSATISASEKISMSYTQNSGQSIPHNVATTFIPNIREEDSHGVFNTTTGEITMPRSGRGQLKFSVLFNNSAGGSTFYFDVFKDGVLYRNQIGRINSPVITTNYAPGPGCVDVYGVAGTKFTVRVFQNTGASLALISGSAFNYLQFSMD
jgi:hypothetical protein